MAPGNFYFAIAFGHEQNGVPASRCDDWGFATICFDIELRLEQRTRLRAYDGAIGDGSPLGQHRALGRENIAIPVQRGFRAILWHDGGNAAILRAVRIVAAVPPRQVAVRAIAEGTIRCVLAAA